MATQTSTMPTQNGRRNPNAPMDQRAHVRPISFVLDRHGFLSPPVTLNIRPTDLTRTEPSRVAVHQTLGRDVQGWADNFGAGLPSITIAGHTGWRRDQWGWDGATAFEHLNKMVAHEYHASKQAAINSGRNPAGVKLLFVDMLDNFAWNVAPMTFVLRRSRTQPLLFQYNITLQAVSDRIDDPMQVFPFLANIPLGIDAMRHVVGVLETYNSFDLEAHVRTALEALDRTLGPVATQVSAFSRASVEVFKRVDDHARVLNNGVSSAANMFIGIAADIASVGVAVFRTIQNVRTVPVHVREAITRVAGAYNEALCILRNSLKAKPLYEEYTGLYGASNCSSTSGGRPPSAYSNMNAFQLMTINNRESLVSNAAYASIGAIKASDPALSPMPMGEVGRHLSVINEGLTIQ